jgi:hypothetical protein
VKWCFVSSVRFGVRVSAGAIRFFFVEDGGLGALFINI